RPDVCQFHDHWTRRRVPRPGYLDLSQSKWDLDKAVFERRRTAGFPGAEGGPMGMALLRGVQNQGLTDAYVDELRAAARREYMDASVPRCVVCGGPVNDQRDARDGYGSLRRAPGTVGPPAPPTWVHPACETGYSQ